MAWMFLIPVLFLCYMVFLAYRNECVPKFKVGDIIGYSDTEAWEERNPLEITDVGKRKYQTIVLDRKYKYTIPFSTAHSIYEKIGEKKNV